MGRSEIGETEMTEYTLEFYAPGTEGRPGHWIIAGSRKLSADAQHDFDDRKARQPELALRVVENPSRLIVVMHAPDAAMEAR